MAESSARCDSHAILFEFETILHYLYVEHTFVYFCTTVNNEFEYFLNQDTAGVMADTQIHF